MLSVVGRLTAAVTLQVPPAVAGNGARASWAGVIAVVAPETVAAVPSSVQVADQVTVASPLVVAVTPTVIVVGAVIVSVTVQVAVAPDPLQKPATFAAAIVTLPVTAPIVSSPVKRA